MTDTRIIHGYRVVFDQGETNWGAVVEDIPGVCFTVAATREEYVRLGPGRVSAPGRSARRPAPLGAARNGLRNDRKPGIRPKVPRWPR